VSRFKSENRTRNARDCGSDRQHVNRVERFELHEGRNETHVKHDRFGVSKRNQKSAYKAWFVSDEILLAPPRLYIRALHTKALPDQIYTATVPCDQKERLEHFG
jgi:hypothetical protein